MTIKYLVPTALSLILTALTTAPAYALSGNQFHEICTNPGSLMRATCDAYAWGAVEGLTFMRKVDAELSKGTMARLLFCTPENITPQQISDVVKNYVRDHPEERSNTTSEMALIAMLRAFPCK